MNEKFRINKSHLWLGIAFTALFGAVVLGHAGLFFLREPEKHGFNGELSAATLGCMGVAIYGTMALLGVYLMLCYRIGYFSVDGAMITIRTVLRKRQFDLTTIRQLQWESMRGTLAFHLLNEKAKLDLSDFSCADRLRIVRLLRGLVPEDLQEGWPLFCYRFALPLRERSRSAGSSQVEDTRHDRRSRVLITRKRCDRMFAVTTPIAVVIGGIGAWESGRPEIIGASVVLCCVLWLVLRFSVPPEGQWEQPVTVMPGGKSALLAATAIVVSTLVMVGSRLCGASNDASCCAALVVLLPLVPFIIAGLYRAEKERKQKEAAGSLFANDVWLKGEAE
jgi:hypothetical protein